MNSCSPGTSCYLYRYYITTIDIDLADLGSEPR